MSDAFVGLLLIVRKYRVQTAKTLSDRFPAEKEQFFIVSPSILPTMHQTITPCIYGFQLHWIFERFYL
jgi:hypothetical protein